jgi:tRNA pseudouridine38-40 synthase
VRIALGIEYDGAGFNGWQTQSDRRSVQDALEGALGQLAGQPVATICAGRTDTGVHAIDQVVHFDTAVDRPLNAWVRGTNRFLPASVSVRWARPVADDFHARYSARRRSYDYWILNDAVRSPLAHARATWIFRPLDTDAMQRAAASLIGTHDFTSFRSAECQAASPVRELQQLEVLRSGRWVRVRATANAFLHHMVRNIAGSLVSVGLGRQSSGWVAELLAMRDRSRAAPTLAADGLYLARVEYDARFNLPAPDGTSPHRFDAYADQDLWPDTRG